MANHTTIGIIRIRGLNSISVNFTDMSERSIAAIVKVMIILTMLVLESEITSSRREISAESTDIKLPVCLSSKYEASMSMRDLAASILMSCCALYEVACQR